MKTEDNKDWIDGYLYNRQSRRKLNPLYIFLTKFGIVWLIVFYLYVKSFGVGGFSLLFFGSALYWYYKNKFFYAFWEKEKIWLIRKYIGFISNRYTPIKSEPFVFKVGEGKKAQSNQNIKSL